MSKTAKVAVTIPKDVLLSLDRACKKSGTSRSAAVAQAVEQWLRLRTVSDAERRYVEGYLRKPETAHEVTATAAVADAAIQLWDTWDDPR
jgi:metal-responsive CopG/Arc/MetJ family transcriptional regulator